MNDLRSASLQLDYEASKVRRVNVSSGVVTTLAGSVAGQADGVGSAAKLDAPYGVALNSLGTVAIIVRGALCGAPRITRLHLSMRMMLPPTPV